MLVDAHTHGPSAHPAVRILSLSELRGDVPVAPHFAVGVHPWDISQTSAADLVHVERWSTHAGCVAIGETGLDRVRATPWDQQLRLLLWHWDLAEERKLPLVLHAVRSSSDLLALLKRRKPALPWLWHDFSGPVEVVKSALKLHPGLSFSFSPRSVRRSDFRRLWESVPEDKRLLETDDSGISIEELYRAVQPPEDRLAANFEGVFALTRPGRER